MSCHFTDFLLSLINRFHLAGLKVILYLGISNTKNQLRQLDKHLNQLIKHNGNANSFIQLSFLESYKYKNNVNQRALMSSFMLLAMK